jgi:hypothetical protein
LQPLIAGDAEITGWKDGQWTFDVFISHAGEDKTFAFRLRDEFERVGLRTFLDQADLFGGDSADGVMLTACRGALVGLALLSVHSLKKKWPVEELKLIVAESTLLPVLYNIGHEDVEKALKALGAKPQAGGRVDPDEWQEFVRTVTRTTAEKNPSTSSDQLPFVQLIVFAAVRLCVNLSPLVEKHSLNPASALAFVKRLENASFAISKRFNKLPKEKTDSAKRWYYRMQDRAKALEKR